MEQEKTEEKRTEQGKSFRLEAAAIVILIPFIGVLFLLLLFDRGDTNKAVIEGAVEESTPAASQVIAGGERPTDSNETSERNKQNVGDTALLTVESPLGSSEYQVAISESQTVAEVMSKAADKQTLRYDFTDYGGDLGILVTGINGLNNNDQAEMYWYLYINGQVSEVGASAAKLKAGDIVSWRYEKIHET